MRNGNERRGPGSGRSIVRGSRVRRLETRHGLLVGSATALLLVSLVAVALSVPAAASSAGPTTQAPAIDGNERTSTQSTGSITDCTVIDQPGRYQLAANVSGNGTCIEITASDVVLDGQSHAVSDDDPNHEGIGIAVNGSARLSNVTVTNVVLKGWYWNSFGKHGHNLRLTAVDDVEVSDVTIAGGDYGIRLTNVTNATIRNNDIAQTDDPGLYLEAGSNQNRFVDNQITQSNKRGVLIHNSHNNTFHSNEIAGSGGENVRLAWTASWNTFTDNHIHSTGWGDGCVGIGQSGSNLYFHNNTVAGCSGHSISLSQAGENFTITENTFDGTGGHGVRFSYTSNVTVRNNTITGADGHGINLQRSSGHVVRDNNVTDVGRFGINFNDVHDSVAADNRVNRVGNGGVRLFSGSSNNTLRGNTILSYTRQRTITFPTAVRLVNARNNTLVDNHIENSHRGVEINDSANDNTLTDNTVWNAEGVKWAFATARSSGTTVERLDVDSATAPNTTLSFTAYNVSVSPNASAPANPNADGIGHVFEAQRFGTGTYLDVRVHYASSDVSSVDESLLALWTHDGTAWAEVDRSRVNPRDGTVGANLTSYSTVGAFATGEGESHTVTPASTSTPQPTSTPEPTDAPADTETSTSTGTDTATSTTETPTTSGGSGGGTTTSGSGPGFGALATLAALAGAVVLDCRRRN